MNLRESGARTARTVTATLGIVGAALASLIGVSIWAGTTAAASTGTTSVQGDQQQNILGGQSGFVAPGNGGGSHGNSNGS